MIRSFRCKETKALFDRSLVTKIPVEVQRAALRKLRMLHAAVNLLDLEIPPSNHLERLHGNREGEYSIRVNQQWRLCFRFEVSNVFDVEIVDYH